MIDPVKWKEIIVGAILGALITIIVSEIVKYFQKLREKSKTKEAIDEYSKASLGQKAAEIEGLGEIPRPEIDQIISIWQSHSNSIILHGEAGTGKSGIALRLGQSLVNKGTSVLFINTAELPNDEDPIIYVQRRMTIEKPLLNSIKNLSDKKECVIIIDQIDSKAGTDLCKEVVGFIKSISNFPKVKILVVTRTYDLQHDPDISSLNFPQIPCRRLTPEQTNDFLFQLGIKSQDKTLIEIASNLLNLSLISQVIKSFTDKNISFVDETDLWKQYFSILEHKDEDKAKYILTLARYVTAQGERSFTLESTTSEYKRALLSQGILIEKTGRRYAFRHEDLQDFLCAYAILPDRPTFDQVYAEFGQESSKGVIKWLHRLYHSEFRELEATFIDEVLSSKNEIPFYTRTIILENLKEQKDPTNESAKVLKKHLADLGYGRFFFDELDNPAWISPLYELKTFSEPPAPIEISKDSIQLPEWPAGKYLVRFASQCEDIVVDVVQSIKTENTRVHETLIDAMLKISPGKTSKLVPIIDEWLDSKFSVLLPYDLIPLVDLLWDNKYYDAATQILEFVTKPILQPNQGKYSKYVSPICFRSGTYWVEDFYQKEFPKLAQTNSLRVVLTFEQQLKHAIELTEKVIPNEYEKYVGLYWRSDIAKTLTDQSSSDALDLLINGLLDSLDEVCKQDIEAGRQLLTNYLRSEHIIFKRIALSTLQTYGIDFPDVLNEALLQEEFLKIDEFTNEYQWLLKNQFNTASDVVKNQVIGRIISALKDLEVGRISFWLEYDYSDQGRDYYRLILKLLSFLEIVKDHLHGEVLADYYKLSGLASKLFLRSSEIEFRKMDIPPSITIDSLSKMSFDEIKELFITSNSNHSLPELKEDLAYIFQDLIIGNPEKYKDFAKFLIDPQIPLIFTFYYLEGLYDGIVEQSVRINDDLLLLCEFIVNIGNECEKESLKSQLETLIKNQIKLSVIQREVANLLSKALQSNDFYLSFEQLIRIKKLLIILAHNPDPSLTEEVFSSIDPLKQSINCVRGMAMHGVFRYSLYVFHSQLNQSDKKTQYDHLEPDIKLLLEEKLDLAQETSLAVHSVFGTYFSNLYYLSLEWLKRNLKKIFPENESKYWQAAWDAYILTTNPPIKAVFDLLIPQYDRAIRKLGSPQETQNYSVGSPNEKLAEHIMAAYLSGFTDFGHENKLLELFFSYAPDETRAHGIFWIYQALLNIDLPENMIIWDKCWALWQNRLEVAENQEVSINALEISNYMKWLESCPEDLGFLFPTLQKSVKYFQEAYDIHLLIEFVAKQSRRYPLYAVNLLQMVISAEKESWWRPSDEDEEQILKVAMASKEDKAIKIAREIINYRGEQGDYRWKYLLD